MLGKHVERFEKPSFTRGESPVVVVRYEVKETWIPGGPLEGQELAKCNSMVQLHPLTIL